ncbi:MAG: alpha/beta fold hydrolase [Thioalkalivibrio sp.]|nr:alpha/beta fold hydrolase [Thioalkalivibrio sp.]
MSRQGSRVRSRFKLIVSLAFVSVLLTMLWTWWTESHPQGERELRDLVQDQLHEWFPEEMAPASGVYGLFLRSVKAPDGAPPRVVLVHGLDEPGSIWDDLVPALEEAGFEVWEFRYPNDQGIDRSTDLLAEHWSKLEPHRPVVLIGHSMGGLVVRDFVSRLRHPEGAAPAADGPAVAGVILAGTPNQGSEWARLRVWLELREQLVPVANRRFSLFAGLRDGTGAAKIDLRPGSAFLREMDERQWPARVPVRIIGGILLDSPPSMAAGMESIGDELVSSELDSALRSWWSDIGDGLGDGVVPVASLPLRNAPPPILVSASHRGMLARFFASDPEPPAISHITDIASGWAAVQSESAGASVEAVQP